MPISATDKMTYLLDSNVFIQAKNLHYGFDFCPAFWDWIDQAHRDGLVYSIRQVKDELLEGQDELADWAAEQPADFFLESDQSLRPFLSQVSTWVDRSDYEQQAMNQFQQVADYYLVATALARGCRIVTHETRGQSSRKKVKIPDAGAALGIKCMTVFKMLREERARFVLSAPRAPDTGAG